MRYPVLETPHLFLRKPTLGDLLAAEGVLPRWAATAGLLHHWDAQGHGPFAVLCKRTARVLGLAGPWSPEGWPEPELVWHLWTDADTRTTEAARAARGFVQTGLGWVTCVSYLGFSDRAGIATAAALGATRDRFADTPAGRDCLVYRHLDTGVLRRAA